MRYPIRLFIMCVILALALPVMAQSELPAFPLPSATDDQIKAAAKCDLSKSESDDADCAIAQTLVPAPEKEPTAKQFAAFTELVRRNPAYALRQELIGAYFDRVSLSAAPEFTESPLVSAEIFYTYNGIGAYADYHVYVYAIDTETPGVQAIAHREARGEETDEPDHGEPLPVSSEVEASLARALGTSLTDLLPIESSIEGAIACYDNYPDWKIDLRYADGTWVKVQTFGSNALMIGGPFQFQITSVSQGGAGYLQYSMAFGMAVYHLFDALKLPLGGTQGMVCSGVDLFPLAYPSTVESSGE